MFCQTLAPVRPRRAFIPSVIIHVAGVALLSVVWVTSPLVEVSPKSAVAVFVPAKPVKVKRVARRAVVAPVLLPPRRHVLVVPREIVAAPALVIPAPPAAPAARPQILAEAPAATVPAPPPRTDVFAGIAPAPPTVSKPAVTVDTGSFAAVPAVAAAPTRERSTRTGVFGATEVSRAPANTSAQVASAGFTGAQAANPAPTRRSAVQAQAGFGAAFVSAPAPEAAAPAVRAGGFGSVSVQGAAAHRQNTEARPAEVEILSKPRPVYSEEARRLKIEGEVLVEVVFTASAKVRVLRVVQGLGHGLDEAAVEAARNIRFKPAERDGHAVDSPAVARIVFSLAY